MVNDSRMSPLGVNSTRGGTLFSTTKRFCEVPKIDCRNWIHKSRYPHVVVLVVVVVGNKNGELHILCVDFLGSYGCKWIGQDARQLLFQRM